MDHLIYKSFAGPIKDVDVKKGIVEGYFNTWDVVDADGDEMVRGAFKKSLQENGPESSKKRIYHLLQHNTRTPLYRFTEEGSLKEDDTGLFFRSSISRTTYGMDTLQLYADGVINEHSVGFQTIKNEQAGEGHMRILEVKLWEGSTVTWGANEWSLLTSIKGKDPKKAAEEFNERIETLSKAIKNGTYTDDTFELLLLQLKQIQGHYQSLINTIQPGTPTGGTGKPGERVKMDEIINLLKF